MNIKLATPCLVLIGALLAPMAASAADDRDADRAHPKAFVKDSAITTKIKAKLAAEKMKSLAQIKVDTDSQGQVVLGGFARTQEDADRAVAIAKATEGVASVQSNITIKKDD
jgi:hyperosmotically inducible protein